MIDRNALSLAWQYSDYTRFHWCVGLLGRKEGGCEDLDGCLTLLLTLLIGTKVDC